MTDEKILMTMKEFLEKYPILKQTELAKRIGLSYSMVAAYKNENRMPSEYTLIKMNRELQKLVKELENIEIF